MCSLITLVWVNASSTSANTLLCCWISVSAVVCVLIRVWSVVSFCKFWFSFRGITMIGCWCEVIGLWNEGEEDVLCYGILDKCIYHMRDIFDRRPGHVDFFTNICAWRATDWRWVVSCETGGYLSYYDNDVVYRFHYKGLESSDYFIDFLKHFLVVGL